MGFRVGLMTEPTRKELSCRLSKQPTRSSNPISQGSYQGRTKTSAILLLHNCITCVNHVMIECLFESFAKGSTNILCPSVKARSNLPRMVLILKQLAGHVEFSRLFEVLKLLRTEQSTLSMLIHGRLKDIPITGFVRTLDKSLPWNRYALDSRQDA